MNILDIYLRKELVAESIGKLPDKVRFTYKMANDYRVIAATGVYGGVTAQGLKCDFFIEYATAPKEEIRKVTEGGGLGEQITQTKTPGTVDITREFQVGVVMSAPDTKVIANWLLQKVAEFEALKVQEQQKKE